MTYGIDVGTTSVAGVAVDEDGRVRATVTRPHEADVAGLPPGVHEQSPEKLFTAVRLVLDELDARTHCPAGGRPAIGWTGQMHGVVAVDERLSPVTDFVTWRDARRFGGNVMAGWAARGLRVHRCLTAPGFAMARLTGECAIDGTFLESWRLDLCGRVPAEWIPDVVPGSMLGDNQAGVYAAQHLRPGCAVVNLGTSGQLSVVRASAAGAVSAAADTATARSEVRKYPGGRVLACRASLVGGRAWAELRRELGISWEEMNARAFSGAADATARRIRECAERIADDLAGGIDMAGVTELVGVGNALRLNPALKTAVERRLDLPCVLLPVDEMAAFGAAVHARDCGKGG